MAIARLLLTLLLVGSAASSLPHDKLRAQSPSVFRTGVDLVQIDVVVLDDNRRPVTGLTAADFTITEEGQPREIQAFAPIALPRPVLVSPGAAAWTRDIAPDVVDNAIADAGRLAVILMDQSIPTGAMTETARAIARATVDALGPNDMAAVVRSGQFADDGFTQNFTADRSLLNEAIDSPFVGLTKAPPHTAFDQPLVDYIPTLTDSINCPCGVCQWYTIEAVANTLATDRERHKVLFFIGRDILINERPDPDPRNDCDVRVSQARDRTLRALDRANVTIHALDTSVLETLAATADSIARTPPKVHLERHGRLAVLPDYTGGRVVLNTNAPESFLPDILEESSTYYLIGFTRREGGRPGERRNIQVRVNRPGVTVRSRTGYYPPSGTAADREDGPVSPSTAALTGLLPTKDLPLSIGLTPRFQPDGAPYVATLLGLDVADPADPEDRSFDVTIGVFDTGARLKGTEQQTIDVPAARIAAADGRVETLTHLPLAPDRYELRLAVTDIIANVTGTVHGYVTVPDDDEALSLSGVLLERSGAPTLVRSFAPTDVVSASLQVRRPSGATAPVAITMRIVDTQDRVAFESTIPLGDTAFGGTRVAEVRSELPLSELAPGEYLLTAGFDDGVRGRNVRLTVR